MATTEKRPRVHQREYIIAIVLFTKACKLHCDVPKLYLYGLMLPKREQPTLVSLPEKLLSVQKFQKICTLPARPESNPYKLPCEAIMRKWGIKQGYTRKKTKSLYEPVGSAYAIIVILL
jgi:hypothetical protein